MANRFCAAVAVGLLLAVHAHAQGRTAVHGAPSRQVELSEAFPWDEPVEQTFTVDSVLRWAAACRPSDISKIWSVPAATTSANRSQ